MISSTRADLMQYRRAAVKVFDELNIAFGKRGVRIERVDMETEPQTGDGETAVEISKTWVEASHWVILIVGRHYGTITGEEGANGKSVTEWEYRHALAKEKKVFLFLSGPPGSTDAYDGRGDDNNLANWTEQQNEAQAAGLKAFRMELGGKVAALFRNAQDFESKLRATLIGRLIDLGPDLSDPALRALFAMLHDKSLKPCFRGVKQLYRSKEIHDAIHRLRQHALVPLRDAVDRKKRREESKGLQKTVGSAQTMMGAITEKSSQLGDDGESADLKGKINLLGEEVRALRVLDDDDKPLPIVTIDEQLNACFSALEKAFAAANTAMGTRKDLFAELHNSMTLELERAGRGNLPPRTVAQIDEEIRKTMINRERLLGTLKDHDTWQAVHSEVVEANSSGKVAKQRRCVEREAPRLAESIKRIRAQARSDDEDISALDWEFAKLADAQAKRLAQPYTEPEDAQKEAWDEFCHAFDACFFAVDARTLAVVGRSKARVEDLEASFKHAGIDKSSDA